MPFQNGNRVKLILAVAASALGVVIGLESAFGVIDRAVVTEAELEQHEAKPHQDAVKMVEELDLKQECRWLDDKIDRLKDQIREFRISNRDPDWIAEKEKDLSRLIGKFNAKQCHAIGYI